MRCSGCGKDIPFSGSVCPYCQRDKSKDQAYMVAAVIFGATAGAIGYYIFGVWGALCGFIIGCIAAAFMTLGSDSKPPQIEVVNTSPTDDSIAIKLTQLKDLHYKGLITDEEFASKKTEILNKL